MRPGVCCIVLGLEEQEPPMKFKKMTFSSFSKKERGVALELLGERILNNMETTFAAIRFCFERNYCYRLSSDLFPLVTYEKAELSLEQLPQYGLILNSFNSIKSYLESHPTRISCHPSEFNVLATENIDALTRTVRELNFYSWFMDQIGCPADYNSPMNVHINNNQGLPGEITERFRRGLEMLDDNCRARLVVENDDKPACWSVKKLVCYLHEQTGCPITFDYLHHRCHPDNLTEEQALRLCYDTWGDYRPLFHYSESRDQDNIRAHADYPSVVPDNYGLDFDLDFEFKMKDKAIFLFESLNR